MKYSGAGFFFFVDLLAAAPDGSDTAVAGAGLPDGVALSCARRSFSILSAILAACTVDWSDWAFCDGLRASLVSSAVPPGQGAWL